MGGGAPAPAPAAAAMGLGAFFQAASVGNAASLLRLTTSLNEAGDQQAGNAKPVEQQSESSDGDSDGDMPTFQLTAPSRKLGAGAPATKATLEVPYDDSVRRFWEAVGDAHAPIRIVFPAKREFTTNEKTSLVAAVHKAMASYTMDFHDAKALKRGNTLGGRNPFDCRTLLLYVVMEVLASSDQQVVDMDKLKEFDLRAELAARQDMYAAAANGQLQEVPDPDEYEPEMRGVLEQLEQYHVQRQELLEAGSGAGAGGAGQGEATFTFASPASTQSGRAAGGTSQSKRTETAGSAGSSRQVLYGIFMLPEELVVKGQAGGGVEAVVANYLGSKDARALASAAVERAKHSEMQPMRAEQVLASAGEASVQGVASVRTDRTARYAADKVVDLSGLTPLGHLLDHKQWVLLDHRAPMGPYQDSWYEYITQKAGVQGGGLVELTGVNSCRLAQELLFGVLGFLIPYIPQSLRAAGKDGQKPSPPLDLMGHVYAGACEVHDSTDIVDRVWDVMFNEPELLESAQENHIAKMMGRQGQSMRTHWAVAVCRFVREQLKRALVQAGHLEVSAGKVRCSPALAMAPKARQDRLFKLWLPEFVTKIVREGIVSAPALARVAMQDLEFTPHVMRGVPRQYMIEVKAYRSAIFEAPTLPNVTGTTTVTMAGIKSGAPSYMQAVRDALLPAAGGSPGPAGAGGGGGAKRDYDRGSGEAKRGAEQEALPWPADTKQVLRQKYHATWDAMKAKYPRTNPSATIVEPGRTGHAPAVEYFLDYKPRTPVFVKSITGEVVLQDKRADCAVCGENVWHDTGKCMAFPPARLNKPWPPALKASKAVLDHKTSCGNAYRAAEGGKRKGGE